MASYNKIFSVLIVAVCVFSTASCVQECMQQKCLECPSSAISEGEMSPTRCELRNLVSLTWLNVKDAAPLPNPQEQDVDYACIKMTASSRTFIGDSTDVIRGCVLKVNAEGVCNQLTGMEKTREKVETSCTYCENDSCNGAFSINHTPATIFLLTVATLVKFFSF